MTALHWRTLVALVAIYVAVFVDQPWLWGVLLLLWVLPDLWSGHTWLVDPLERKETPMMFWLVTLTWLWMGLALVLDPGLERTWELLHPRQPTVTAIAVDADEIGPVSEMGVVGEVPREPLMARLVSEAVGALPQAPLPDRPSGEGESDELLAAAPAPTPTVSGTAPAAEPPPASDPARARVHGADRAGPAAHRRPHHPHRLGARGGRRRAGLGRVRVGRCL